MRQSRDLIKKGVAETGLSLPCVRDLQVCAACLQASPRRVRKPRSGGRDLRVCEARLQASPRGVVKTIPQSACADSSLYTREPENSAQTTRLLKFLLPTFLFKEKYGAYFSLKRKVGFYGLKLYHRLSALSIIFKNLHYILLFLILCSDIMTLQ